MDQVPTMCVAQDVHTQPWHVPLPLTQFILTIYLKGRYVESVCCLTESAPMLWYVMSFLHTISLMHMLQEECNVATDNSICRGRGRVLSSAEPSLE